jgi:tetratricopeptide (TPR) repeat protein
MNFLLSLTGRRAPRLPLFCIFLIPLTIFARDKKVLINSEPEGAKVVFFNGDVRGGMICKPVSKEGVDDVTPCALTFDESAFDPMGRYWERSRILGVPIMISLYKEGYRPREHFYLTEDKPRTWKGKDVMGKIEKQYYFITQEKFDVKLDPDPDYARTVSALLQERPSDALRDVNARDALGDCGRFYAEKQLEKAINACNTSIGLNPEHPDPQAYYYRCLANYKLNRLEAALQDCQQLTKLKKDDEIGWNDAGLILQALGRQAEAVVSFTVALSLNPRNAIALRNRAISYEKLNRIRDALRDCDGALTLAPNDPELLKLRTRLLSLGNTRK